MIDLATLTGAIVVALGHEYAACSPTTTSSPSGSPAPARRPASGCGACLGPEYDKSRFEIRRHEDTGGATAASRSAALAASSTGPVAHLDIAGTGMRAADRHQQSWASGWGVRLLDRLVAEYYEK
jgi:leucyl aminopeptidase